MAVRGIALYRGAPLPAPKEAERITLRSIDGQEADPWQSPTARRASLTKADGGGWRLSAVDAGAGALAFVAAGCEEPYEAVFQLEDVSPGVGVYVGDSEGQPFGAVGIFKRTSTEQLALGFARPESRQTEISLSDDKGPLPLVGRSFWLRLVVSPWGLRASSSPDGVFWSEVLPPQKADVEQHYRTLGLFVARGAKGAALKVRRLEVRQLRDLAGILRGRQLSGHREDLLESILEWAGDGSASAKGIPGAIEGAALVDGRTEGLDFTRIDRALDRLAEVMSQDGETRSRIRVFSSLLGASFPAGSRLDPIPEALFRSEALEAVYLHDWERALSLTQWFELWEPSSQGGDGRGESAGNRESRSRSRALASWTRAVAVKASPSHASIPAQHVLGSQHPLITELSKEGFNVLTELEAALTSESYRDACDILSAVEARGTRGLVPDPRDPDLLVSLPSAVKLALKDYPLLERTLRDELGPLAMLRFREARSEADAGAMESITIQFVGTEAAGEAHAWLGDRLLAQGSFADALSHYEKALEKAPGPSRPGLSARLQLAAAYVGRFPSVEAMPAQVDLGGMRLNGRELEQIISRLRKDAGASMEATSSSAEMPPPGRYSTRSWARFEHFLEQKPRGVPDGSISVP